MVSFGESHKCFLSLFFIVFALFLFASHFDSDYFIFTHTSLLHCLLAFITRFEAAYWKVEKAGKSILASHHAYKLKQSLTSDYDYLVRQFDKMVKANFTYANIKTSIINEFNKKIQHEKLSLEIPSANQAAVSTTYRNISIEIVPKTKQQCKHCKRTNHQSEQCRAKPKLNLHLNLLSNKLISQNFLMTPTQMRYYRQALTGHLI